MALHRALASMTKSVVSFSNPFVESLPTAS